MFQHKTPKYQNGDEFNQSDFNQLSLVDERQEMSRYYSYLYFQRNLKSVSKFSQFIMFSLLSNGIKSYTPEKLKLSCVLCAEKKKTNGLCNDNDVMFITITSPRQSNNGRCCHLTARNFSISPSIDDEMIKLYNDLLPGGLSPGSPLFTSNTETNYICIPCFAALYWNYYAHPHEPRSPNKKKTKHANSDTSPEVKRSNSNSSGTTSGDIQSIQDNEQTKIEELLTIYNNNNQSDSPEFCPHSEDELVNNLIELTKSSLPYNVPASTTYHPHRHTSAKNSCGYSHLCRFKYNDPRSHYPFIFDLCPSDVKIHFQQYPPLPNTIPMNSTPYIDSIFEYISQDIITFASIVKEISQEPTDWQTFKRSTDNIVDICNTRYLTHLDKHMNKASFEELSNLPLIGIHEPTVNHLLEFAQLSNIMFTRRMILFTLLFGCHR
jgi:hypothetical protein